MEREDYNAETINLIDDTIAMFKEDIPGSITMNVDSGASHILIRHEHAHVLQNVSCTSSECYATIKCAKQGTDLTAIGTGSLSIERVCIQAFVCRDNELQHSSTARGCTTEFTFIFLKLHHAACLQPILVGYKESPTKPGYGVERKMNYELDFTHGEVKWTRGHILKVEVVSNPSIWLDSFGVMFKCLSKYFTRFNLMKFIYERIAI